MNEDFFRGKTVLVMGLGHFGGGVDSAKFAHHAGAKVIVTDVAEEALLGGPLKELDGLGIEFHLGGHLEQDFRQVDIVIVNPAVPPDNPFLNIAGEEGKVITSQIEIFFKLCPAPIIGITGANGKSTTTALTGHLLKAGVGQKGIGYWNVFVSGNIGDKPLLGLLENVRGKDLVVLEISSFQAEQLGRIKKAPQVSVITNLTPNHLNRHGTFEAYCLAKENLFRYQSAVESGEVVSIFNGEDTYAMVWYQEYRKQENRVCIKFSVDDIDAEPAKRFKLPGRMNLSNLAAAMTVARYFSVSEERIGEAVESFEGLEHRLEFVAEINGVRWYNDSIATTPVSSIAAMEAFKEPKIIIAGGYDKKIPFDEFGEVIASSVKGAVLIGETAGAIENAIRNAAVGEIVVVRAEAMYDAVRWAAKIAEDGDVVLMSPACASYDMFTNFKERGDIFKQLVNELS